jgi:thioredoxin-like negative regulator of GroEL
MIRSLYHYTRAAPPGLAGGRACHGAALAGSTATSLTSSARRATPRRCWTSSSLHYSFASVVTPPVLWNTARHLSCVTNAANFETEVIQSQQAICLVYYISNSNCSAYLKSAEKLVDAINAETAGIDVPDTSLTPPSEADDVAEAAGFAVETKEANADPTQRNATSTKSQQATSAAQKGTKLNKLQWLKLCTINADENRNLASAFSVERAKLPTTYFVMQGTIVDKVVGHVAEGRLQSILVKFLEHYQKEMNVDLLARHGKGKGGGSSASPLPSAATADLLSGTATTFLQDKIMNTLVGADMIQLPEEAEQLDGIRKTLQEAKKKAHAELQELHKQLGMDIRRLTDAEMHAHYFNSSQFRALGVISGLEALYLARAYATLGDVARTNVEWARHAVLKDFEPIQGDPTLRRVMALVDANLVKGELRTAATLATQDANRLRSTLASMDADDLTTEQHRSALREMETFIAGQSQYCLDMLRIIDAHIDSRTLDGSEFPSAVMDELFTALKANQKLSRTRLPTASIPSAQRDDTLMVDLLEGKALDTTAKRVFTAQVRVPQIRTIITCLVQLYPSDPKAQAARSRLSSLMY